ncbi:hypothetical protein [Chitinophaga rhizosphaerae]|uniref:hypothetical protein n=1 Tax=Chitinophaga rhizosphaerae TaxID=1864947 RepID=UPI000F808864|nr:hypothetical protein [Chitinophaga rhizosphaerae]
MADNPVEWLSKEHKFAGFEMINDQLQLQVAAGMTEFKLEHQDRFHATNAEGMLEHRMAFTIQSRILNEKGFYNGFDATIVKNMPTDLQIGDISLKELEIRLQSPPQPWNTPGSPTAGYEQIRAKYDQELTADLIKVHDTDQRLFYKLVALYQSVIDPLLAPDHRQSVMDILKTELDGDVRRQRFYNNQAITRVEAFNLLDSVDRPRAVLKHYRTNDETKDQQETYSRWLIVNYEKPANEYGTRELRNFGAGWGFDHRNDISRFNLEFSDDKHFERFLRDIEKGHKVGVPPVDKTEHEMLYFYVNIQRKTFTIEDGSGELVKHDRYLTEMAKQERSERNSNTQNVPTRAIGPASDKSDDDQKKNDQRERIVGPDREHLGPRK